MLSLAERLRDRYWLASALWISEIAPRVTGDWKTARDISDRCLTVDTSDPRPLSTRIMLEHEVGNLDPGEAHLERLLELMGPISPEAVPVNAYSAILIPMIARITGVVGRFDIADAVAGAVISSPTAVPRYTNLARAGLALMAVYRNDTAAAEEQYVVLESARGTMLSADLASVDRLLGLLSQTMGNMDQAAAHFEDALAFCRKAGYRPELAWTCCDYADALRGRNSEGDRPKALSLLGESLAISNELGMRPLMERVLSRREILGA